MAASLSLTLSRNCANIGVIQKMQWSAESTKCFLKPSTYPVCRKTALGMIGEKAAMKQIKKFYIRGCHHQPEKVVLPETIQTDIKCLRETVEKIYCLMKGMTGVNSPTGASQGQSPDARPNRPSERGTGKYTSL